MAYSVTFNHCAYPAKYITSPTKSPFQYWLSKCKGDSVIFGMAKHYGPDICNYMHFFPDSSGTAGYFIFTYDGDYIDYDITARVLIDNNTKELYISDVIINYECYLWSYEMKYNGNVKALKKLNGSLDILKDMTNTFFGNDWIYHLRCTRRHERNIYKSTLRKLKKAMPSYENLPEDVKNIIITKALPWASTVEKKVSTDKKNELHALVQEHFGTSVSDNDFGEIHAWKTVIGVFL